MRVIRVPDEGPCEVVVAEFVFGAQGCGEQTRFIEQDSGHRFRVCREHIEASR